MSAYMEQSYFVYIMASPSGTLYIGVTSNLERRVAEHKTGALEGFSKKYGCAKLVYFMSTSDVWSALEHEKYLKTWNRHRKEELIADMNPKWRDLSEDF